MGGVNNKKRQQVQKQTLTKRCYEYLNNNFGRFSARNKLVVALEITKKDMVKKVDLDDRRKVDEEAKQRLMNRIRSYDEPSSN